MKSREWLLYNAVVSWLNSYGGQSDLTPEYKLLEEELKQVYEQSINTETRKRRRPAKRQRKKEPSSNPSSTEENKATTQET